MLKTSKLKDNRQINDVIQVCFILESYHQRGPTHPTEDTDRLYPEDFHQRTNTSNRGYRQTLPRGFPSERGYRQTLPRGLPSERTNTSNRGRYRHTLLNRRLPSDGETTTKPQEIKRENWDTTSERNQQRQTREYQTAEQSTSIKVKYCKTSYLIRWFIVKTS